ncbi:MAG: GntR family transcriptional regulator [Oscillospiraceae bacterium]|nr:GntR family transcriptional regulator [Oscillospiraceae bacterium]
MTPLQLEELKEKNPAMSLNDMVHELVLQEIISFRAAPGTRLSESGIAQELGVSRSPVKSALDRLAERKFVRVQSSRYYVAEFDEQEYREICDFNMMVEPYATSKAALHATPEQLSELYELAYELRDIYDEASRSGAHFSYSRILETEIRFHLGIVRASGNRLLTQLYEERRHEIWRYRGYLLYSRPEGFFDTCDTDHVLICDLLKLRDDELAAAIARRHLHVSRDGIERYELLSNHPKM